ELIIEAAYKEFREGKDRKRSNFNNKNEPPKKTRLENAPKNGQEVVYNNLMEVKTCYECHKPGHLRRNCPLLNGRGFRHGNGGNNVQYNMPNLVRPGPPTNQQGNVFASIETKEDSDNAVVEGTLLLFSS
ncbi:hypothetical protein MKW92_012936, partial [Papaver armeniacum]